ncbi:inositol-3-phosphate synthase [Roseobacter sp.]|uniref:inositol-3-phosphate synthase n=1 Tax=Roseobacter sp. TaxID=1907202 RepID=UPI002966B3D9|nr:inositol-3-phosphate synthase [Roseobacter sp.]MDW3180799.1 inositol-3-phosphate synthase [Roseobacter sp.]
MLQNNAIRVAVVGMGNCGSSLTQLIHGALSTSANDRYGGVFWANGRPHSNEDFRIVAAFDVDREKVGQDLGDAVEASTNCTPVVWRVPHTGVTVQKGPRLDGIDGPLAESVIEADVPDADVRRVLADTSADIVVNMLPTGAREATEFYADAALEVGCGFVNCIPIPLATNAGWAARFQEAGVPLFGDDVKSQMGTTTVHQTLVDLIQRKGGQITRTYQMNIGGNADFRNMTDAARRAYKNVTKTSAVQSHVEGLDIPDIGPNGFVEPLGDNKRAHVMIGAELALGMQVEINLNLTVTDSPNAAGVILPAVLECARARRRGDAGVLPEVSDNFFKMPVAPVQKPHPLHAE